MIICNDLTSCFSFVLLQKVQKEETTLVQTDVKWEEPTLSSVKLNKPAKKVHGKELKGPEFSSKPQVILFKVPRKWGFFVISAADFDYSTLV